MDSLFFYAWPFSIAGSFFGCMWAVSHIMGILRTRHQLLFESLQRYERFQNLPYWAAGNLPSLVFALTGGWKPIPDPELHRWCRVARLFFISWTAAFFLPPLFL